jgi:hypothetical protein
MFTRAFSASDFKTQINKVTSTLKTLQIAKGRSAFFCCRATYLENREISRVNAA